MTIRFFAMLGLLATLGCNAPKSETDPAAVEKQNVSERLANLPNTALLSVDEAAGETRAENLLYLMGMNDAAKGGAIIGFDGQIQAYRTMGKREEANELEELFPVYEQAIDEKMPAYIADVAKIFEARFNDAEIERLIVLHSDPVMQKLIGQNTQLMSEATIIAEDWGILVGQRMVELAQESDAE